MKKTVNKFLSVILAVVCVLSMLPQMQVSAATTITDNYTKATAYNFGKWSSINSSGTAVMAEKKMESWFKFTVAAGEHIYIRTSSDAAYEGMSVQIKDSSGVNIGEPEINSRDLIDTTGVTPALYIDVDNNTSLTKTFYIVVSRGDLYEPYMYFSFSAYNRIRTGSGSFSFPGTASNAGNLGLSLSGVDSSILNLNLTDNTAIPKEAIVTRVETSGTQTPGQGGVRHMIMPASSGLWYTSTVSSESSGSYSISLADNFLAKQMWSFKYNALAKAKSTMKNVKIRLYWQYDLNQTNYQIFIN